MRLAPYCQHALPNEERAQLITIGGYQTVWLTELGQRRVRLRLSGAPDAGATLLVHWKAQEHLGTVTRADGEGCDVLFDEVRHSRSASDPAPSDRHSRDMTADHGFGRRGRLRWNVSRCEGVVANGDREWSVVLRSGRGGAHQVSRRYRLLEEMFLLGSPLAHVVAFEAALHDEGRSARSRLPAGASASRSSANSIRPRGCEKRAYLKLETAAVRERAALWSAACQTTRTGRWRWLSSQVPGST